MVLCEAHHHQGHWISADFPNLGLGQHMKRCNELMMVWYHMPIHIIWKLSNILYYVGRRCGNHHSRLGQSHSHCTIVSFVAQQLTPGFQLTSPMRANTCGDNGLVIDGSICPSTAAYEGFQTPVIWWDRMWNPFYVNMEPELCHLYWISAQGPNLNLGQHMWW